MYWNRTPYGLPALVLLVTSALPAFAAPDDDQYAVASAHYRSARWDLAADEFEAFLDQYPDHPRADTVRFFLGESLIQLARYPQAERHFQELLERSPRHQFARQARFRLGEAAYLAGQDHQAQEHLQRFRTEFSADGLNAYALPYLADIRLRAGDAQAAESDYAEALRKFPEGPLADECRFGIGKAYQQLGDFASAERFYRFLTLDEDAPLAADALLQIAKLQHQQQQYDAARQTLTRFLERYAENPLRTQASYWLGKTQVAQGQWAEASVSFDQAQAGSDDPELSAAICFDRAECLRQLGEVPAARQLYERIQQQWPASTWAAEALQARVMLAFQTDDAAAVDKLAQQFLRDHGDHALATQVRQLHGRSLLKHQQFHLAADVFRALLQSSESRTARYYLALAELGAGQFEACLNTLRQLRAGAPDDPAQDDLESGRLEAEAAALLGLKRYAEAIAPLQAYLQARPEGDHATKCRAQLTVALTHEKRLDDADPVFDQLRAECTDVDLLLKTTVYLAEANSQAGRPARARELYGLLAEERNPPEYVAQGLSGLAWTAVQSNDLAESERAFGRLVERFPDAEDAAEAALMRAVALERLQKSQQAIDAYRGVYRQFPDSPQAPQALLAAAQILESLKQLEDAQQLLGEAAERYQQFERGDVVLYLRAWLLEDLGRGEEADEVFAKLAEQWPQSTYWADATYRLAERAARGGDFEQAIQLADRLLANQGAGAVRSHALYLRGQLAATCGKWEQVDEPMGTLVREFPDSELRLPAEYWRAEAAYRIGRYELAGQRFDQLALHTDGRSDPWLGMVPLRRAQVLAQQKKWQEAEALVAPIAEQFPGFRQQYEVDYLLGRCLSSRARFDDAREAFGRVVRSPYGGRTETAAMAQWMIGETFFLQKRYEEAVKAYYRVETLFEYPRWQAAALLQAAKCREMQGDWNEAVKLYAQLLKDYPNTRFHEESSRRLRQAKLQATTAATR